MASPWLSVGAWASEYPAAFDKMVEFTFNQADANGDGSIDNSEVKELFNRLCENSKIPLLSEDEISKFQKLMDVDGDGKITLDEYKKFLTNISNKDSTKATATAEAQAYWASAKLTAGAPEKIADDIASAEGFDGTAKAVLGGMLAKLDSGNVTEAKFCDFVATFGPLKDGEGNFVLVDRLCREFASGPNIHKWFYGPEDCKEPEKMVASSPKGSYLLKFASSMDGLTVNRCTVAKGKAIAAKSRLVNCGLNGWLDSLTKKHTPSIQQYLQDYGPSGTKKLTVALDSSVNKEAVGPSTYSDNLDK